MQTEGGFKLSTDSVLLAAFVNMTRVRRCLDIGSGAGVLEVLLAHRAPTAKIVGVELLPEAAELSVGNLSENGLTDRVSILNADVRAIRELQGAESFDLVVSNPPYFAENSGYSAPAAGRAAAREENGLTLTELCRCAAYALRWGGCFALVHRPERLSELFCAMTAAGIEPKRLREAAYSAGRAPSLVLVEGKKGAKPGLAIEPPLILTDMAGGDSEEIRRIYHRGEFAPGEEAE